MSAREKPSALLAELLEVRESLPSLELEYKSLVDKVPDARRNGARNLVHYLALRRRDLRLLQHRLSAYGLSSLGRSESHVAANLDAVLRILFRLEGREFVLPDGWSPGPSHDEGRAAIEARTTALFGESTASPSGRKVRIMVTMPSEASRDPGLIRGLVDNGMDCMRINCANDDALAWRQMIESLRRACHETGRKCRILMDLAGPKLRTGALELGPCVGSWRPHLTTTGEFEAPARIWLTPADAPEPAPPEADQALPVEAQWLAQIQPGERVRLVDLQGKVRRLRLMNPESRSIWAECDKAAFVSSETELIVKRKKGGAEPATFVSTRLSALAPMVQHLQLQTGDALILSRDPTPGTPLHRDAEGHILGEARIPCTLPEIFLDVRPGEKIWFDDGKISGLVFEVRPEALCVRILNAPPPGKKLRADKGINLPESHLTLPALTAKDLADLDFVAEHGDLVGLSFVHRPEDVEQLQAEIQKRTTRDLGIILKIETRRGFGRLPALLLTALRTDPVGVMIARGDLAVECGYQRLAEVQEEILWLCEAAHVPVIWATQVLETLNKKGQPSRAEITDAAMGERAECVMLNKGPHVLEAVRLLDDILARMQSHQEKKVSLLRALSVSRGDDPAGGLHA